MASAASIPESQDSETSGSQSSSNAKTTNSETQSSSESSSESSTESQRTRAAAHSKLMEEAKRIGKSLEALRPQFDDMVNLFSENVREENIDIFDIWKILFADVHNCTRWLPISRSNMNLRLQNPPGKHGMFQVVPRIIFLLHTVLQGWMNSMNASSNS